MRAVPTPCVDHRPPRPGRGVTPMFHSALWVGVLSPWVTARRLPEPLFRGRQPAFSAGLVWGAEPEKDHLLVSIGGLRGLDVDSGVTRRHQRITPPCRRRHATTGTGQTPGPRLVDPLSEEGRPLLAVSGSGDQRECRRMFSGWCVVACHCGGYSRFGRHGS